MRRPLVLVAALLGVALLAGSVTRGSPALSAPGVIRITSLDIQVMVDNRGAPSRSAGDVLLIRQLLFNTRITKHAIGHADLVCTYTSARSRQCNGTYVLPRGKIVVSGAIRFREFYELAVVGGTRLYDNVRGSLTVTLLTRKPRREILLFRLVV
ncbi:MAG TPA: hypothetical protein VGQ68_06130 [Gaiellaceae bacterium]|jgi:hypothetical protein|nr:hypothetical protein [Gaiellaceae bacterium]